MPAETLPQTKQAPPQALLELLFDADHRTGLSFESWIGVTGLTALGSLASEDKRRESLMRQRIRPDVGELLGIVAKDGRKYVGTAVNSGYHGVVIRDARRCDMEDGRLVYREVTEPVEGHFDGNTIQKIYRINVHAF